MVGEPKTMMDLIRRMKGGDQQANYRLGLALRETGRLNFIGGSIGLTDDGFGFIIRPRIHPLNLPWAEDTPIPEDV